MWRTSLIVGLFLLSGCTTPSSLKSLSLKSLPWTASEKKITKSKFAAPARLVAIWTPTTYTQPGKPPTRGLGGRLYFYDDNSQAIPVEGQLVVYAYNDSRLEQTGAPSTQGGQTQPDRKYAFTPEQFAKYYTPSELGASYSVWIPWDPVGGEQVEISLVPVFTATSGQIVMAQSSRHVLTGSKKTETARFDPLPKPSIQQVSFETPTPPLSTSKPSTLAPGGLSTTTISLTPSLLNHLRESEQIAPNFVNGTTNTRQATLPGENKTTSPVAPEANSPWSPPDPRSNHFVRPRHQALTAPRPQPNASPAQWQPGPIVSPSGPASLSESMANASVPANAANAPTTSH